MKPMPEEDEWQHQLTEAGWRLYGQANNPAGGAIYGFIPLGRANYEKREVYGATASEAIQKFLDLLKEDANGSL